MVQSTSHPILDHNYENKNLCLLLKFCCKKFSQYESFISTDESRRNKIKIFVVLLDNELLKRGVFGVLKSYWSDPKPVLELLNVVTEFLKTEIS